MKVTNRTLILLMSAIVLSGVSAIGGYAAATKTAGPAAQPQPAVLPPQGVATGAPQPKILVIDRAAILRLSAVGKDIVAQIEALTKQSDAQFKGEESKLRAEANDLQQQSAILSAAVRAQKQREFNARQEAFQKRVKARQDAIQGGFANAQHQVEQALGPILQELMKERGANLLVDRNAIVLSTVDIDVTAAAIEKLDKVLSKVKVQLAAAQAATPATQKQ